MGESTSERITLATLCGMKARGEKFAMLTAYDHPTAAAAQRAGLHALLIGDSMGTVLLGYESTRYTPLALMVTLADAVRRGAPQLYVVGDIPFEAMQSGPEGLVSAARRFTEEAGCDAVKFEADAEHAGWVGALAEAGIATIVHLGLRPQGVLTPDGYRAQARDSASVASLVALSKRMVESGASMLLLEAVPAEAAEAVVRSVSVPVIGCGAGPVCDGHVLVTQDMLGIGIERPPRFVPRLAKLGEAMEAAMRRYVDDIVGGRYPSSEHVYPMRAESRGANRTE